MISTYTGKIAVLISDSADTTAYQQLAEQLAIPMVSLDYAKQTEQEQFFLTWRDGCLKLLDRELLKKGGLSVDIEPRAGEQRCYPAPKDGALARAIGRKTKTVVDATAGWGQDSLFMFRMGYEVLCLERSPLMAALLNDGLQRLAEQAWLQKLHITPPRLLVGNAIELLARLPQPPDCIYLDPMFEPKRKKSALAKKAMQILHELIGQDDDKAQLFEAAFLATGKRVVVKSPDYAQPLGGKPNESFAGKLVRYDVYLKG
ncbi:MAG: class I SAM-dependent methyltransferase [Methylococcaceae bacterium]